MTDIKLSIIIPCYNAMPYINDLLDERLYDYVLSFLKVKENM